MSAPSQPNIIVDRKVEIPTFKHFYRMKQSASCLNRVFEGDADLNCEHEGDRATQRCEIRIELTQEINLR